MKKHGFFQEVFGRNRVLYLMTTPGVVFLLLFAYLPMLGIIAAFQDYNILDGFFHSKFVGMKNFMDFFTGVLGDRLFNAVGNTLILNTFFILSSLLFQIGTALAIREIGNKIFKNVMQSLLFLPYFLSWIVIGSIIYSIFSSDYGTINTALKGVGLQPIRFYADPAWWKPILVGSHIWKWTGYGSIIYLATMAGFDPAFYEAAVVDGASRFQQLRHITLPLLRPTSVVLVLFSIGRIFYGDLTMVLSITQGNGTIQAATEVIDSYVYRAMTTLGNFSQATAIGLLQSVLGFILIYFSNRFAKRFNEGEALF